MSLQTEIDKIERAVERIHLLKRLDFKAYFQSVRAEKEEDELKGNNGKWLLEDYD